MEEKKMNNIRIEAVSNEVEYINYQTGEKLDLEMANALPENYMLRFKPEMWMSWNFEKNFELNIWDVTKGSNNKAWWICPICLVDIKHNKIANAVNNIPRCKGCSDGISLPERIMTNLLKELNAEFIYNKTLTWSNNKRYDFYIPSLDIIIETHGKQHYIESQKAWIRTLEEEQANDQYKYEIAIQNGVKEYIAIDCKESDFKYIKNNILNSKLTEIYDLVKVDWNKIARLSSRNIIMDLCEFYNTNPMSHVELGAEFNLAVSTIRKYLKKGTEMGLTNYIPNSKKNRELSARHFNKKVVQLDLDGIHIHSHNSIKEAGLSLGLNLGSMSSISACCKGKFKTAYGYKWMYLSEYETIMENQNKIS